LLSGEEIEDDTVKEVDCRNLGYFAVEELDYDDDFQ